MHFHLTGQFCALQLHFIIVSCSMCSLFDVCIYNSIPFLSDPPLPLFVAPFFSLFSTTVLPTLPLSLRRYLLSLTALSLQWTLLCRLNSNTVYCNCGRGGGVVKIERYKLIPHTCTTTPTHTMLSCSLSPSVVHPSISRPWIGLSHGCY